MLNTNQILSREDFIAHYDANDMMAPLNTVFQFRESRLKFIGPYSLERYEKVKEWNAGYMVVLTKYSHLDHLIDEYIDLAPVLDHLMIDKEEFLRPIHDVEVLYV